MKLLELYEKLCTGEIKLRSGRKYWGLCRAIEDNVSSDDYLNFCWTYHLVLFYRYLSKPGKMTPERETLLLLFAAYKGEL